jgi:uncharacterized protein YodC (DUF2158 family)
MTAAFQIGDVVRFKSGGPLMTVSSCADKEEIGVQWFNEHELRTKFFDPAQLVKVDPPAMSMPTPDQVATARERLGTTRLTHKTVIVTDPPDDGYDTTGSPVFVPKRPSDGSGHATR